MWPTTLPSISSLIILDNEGRRLAAKYYEPAWKNVQKQMSFEKLIFSKTSHSTQHELDVLVLDNSLVVYRCASDFQIYVTSSSSENEVIIATVLHGLYGALSLLTNGLLEKQILLEHFDVCMLAIDELIDEGIILEIDPDGIYQRVCMHDSTSELAGMEHPLSQALASAREQISRNLLR
mmetsp:Transcript_4335/g.9365  ORF Transcript_4335/g.9365 Transcript_4335/m.9365 type:complete len:179 (-) Transcript_4335:491-1027(-)|eukprot:CAMPEP_0179719442 /NCGR_PEP_ID=MMETSP0938-20121108/3429_1 /TAXON_ID=548131 ORGANISM="Ostreococcus mediterraneus, Strain clade-D-RCC1107" /NCGR_SAMPLE_ID=MMETSP0938 /ASSEMBLY_ACC=CAM_ASM_000576 /LENGTH=178 /DNA_ID=CAMNT_0021593281 /DNA_START=115 /DNA_END=651 /DNA_ORIENTATION=-